MKYFRAALVLAAATLFAYQQPDPWKAGDVFDAATIAAQLKSGPQPLILQVGFQALYKSVRIPGAKYAGPGSTPDGMMALEHAVNGVEHSRRILIYCGCCPWDKCPNIRPAFAKLAELGFTKVEVLKIPTNVHTDWVEPGYPVEKGAGN